MCERVCESCVCVKGGSGGESPSSVPSCLLSCLQAKCAQEMLLAVLLSPSHSLTLLLPFSSRLLSYSLTHSLAPSLTGHAVSPSPLSCHHRPTSQATCVCRAAALQRCVPCATTGRGFLQVCTRWSSQMATPSTRFRKPRLLLLPSFHLFYPPPFIRLPSIAG